MMDRTTSSPPPEEDRALARWRCRTLALLWVTYASFYLCRVNLAAAQHDLSASLRLSRRQLGLMVALSKLLYGLGQACIGFLTDRLGPRPVVITGLAGTAALNLLFSHLRRFPPMAVTWALNGLLQACGWTPVVRTVANWFPPRLRGGASGIVGTSYVLGGGLSWLVAGTITQVLGWRYAFWIPAWICLVVTALYAATVRVRPSDAGLADSQAEEDGSGPGGDACPTDASPGPLMTARLAALALANLALFFGYHGLLDWTPHYLAEAGEAGAGVAALRAFVMPLGGTLGCLLLTWLSWRPGRALPIHAVAGSLAALAALTAVFPSLMQKAPGAAPGGLLLLGMTSAPPASLIACALPANLAGCDAAGSAAGLVDALGYAGSFLSGWATGLVLDALNSRGRAVAWRAVWRMWSAGIALSALLVGAADAQGR